jgi:hypothetical protein
MDDQLYEGTNTQRNKRTKKQFHQPFNKKFLMLNTPCMYTSS